MTLRAVLMGAALGVLAVGSASADEYLQDGRFLFTLNGAYVSTKSDASGESVDGNSLYFSMEKVLTGAKGSMGLDLFYLDSQESSGGAQSYFSAWPIIFTGRLFLGDNTSPLFAYAGIGAGIQFSNLETLDPQYSVEKDSGLAFTVPLGVRLFLGQTWFVNAGYTFLWMDSKFLDNGIVHVGALGLGMHL